MAYLAPGYDRRGPYLPDCGRRCQGCRNFKRAGGANFIKRALLENYASPNTLTPLFQNLTNLGHSKILFFSKIGRKFKLIHKK